MRSPAKVRRALESADRLPAELFEQHRHSRSVRALATISEVGDQPQLRIASGAMLLAGLFLRDRRLARTGVRMFLAHELATLIKNIVKTSVDRKRPRSSTSREERKVRPGGHTGKEMTSFPSGHTAGSVAVACAVARDYPRQTAFAYGAAGTIAVAQVPQCAHYPTDVGVGLLIGVASEAAAGMLLPACEE